MISTWVSVIVMLLAFVNGARNEDDPQPCAKVQASRSVVPLGSPVTATCVIRDSCPLLTGQAAHIEWRLDDHFLPSSSAANGSSRVSTVVIPHFNRTSASLSCYVRASPDQVVVIGGVGIRAGYPPEAPQNLSCQTNLITPNTLTCRWDPGRQETHLPTKYSLHINIWDIKKNYTYVLPPGVHHYTIPCSDFDLFHEMKIYVKAVNELGEVTSVPVTLEPVSAEDDPQPCAKVQASRSVVPLGSPVTATCVIRDSCPLLTGQAAHIEWRLDDHFLPSSSAANGSSRVSTVVIPSFNHTSASLTCCVLASPDQVVGGVEIRAGYPPEAPQNLSCQTNLTTPNTLTCRWDPGRQETHLPTKYSLHTNIWETKMNYTYVLPPGVHHYTIPRTDFVLFIAMEIYVKAVNELGEVTSVPVTLEPVSAAKFDLPTIKKVEVVPKKYGCLKLTWSLSQRQAWMRNCRLNLEVRLKTVNSSQRVEQSALVNKVQPKRSVDQCRLLHGTQYLAQIRVRYQQSPWSEWSSSQSGVTLESAPTGRLDWWMKVSGDHTNNHLNAHLFWKPSKQFRANGQNVSYDVSGQKLPGNKRKLCSTMGNYCTFQLPRRVKKVYLTAVNAAGKSNPTEIRVHIPRAQTVVSDVSAVPYDDRSLLVQWKSLVSPSLTDFVVEWTPLLKTDPSLIQFEISNRNQTSLVITGSFEPYKPYGISVYPRFKDGIGLPQTVNAYSRQKAPSMVPKIQMKKTWKSPVELTWDEIPLDQRNGFIQSYTIFYWTENGPVKAVNADLKERKVVLKDLDSVPLYEASLMVSTFGGSLNGSTIHFEVESFDAVAVVLIVTAAGVGLSLLVICFVLNCSSNHRRLKGRLWPAVPDPANSSIKRWTSESTQDTHFTSDSEEPNPIYLSHLSFLDLPTKLGKEDSDTWLSGAEDTSDLGESICGSPFIPGYSGSNNDSVPYATVIFSSPCNSPMPREPPVYLRSESTQPLLESEESFSPKCYQNMSTDGMPREQCFFGPHHDCVPEEADKDILWDDFPFLRALALNDAEKD